MLAFGRHLWPTRVQLGDRTFLQWRSPRPPPWRLSPGEFFVLAARLGLVTATVMAWMSAWSLGNLDDGPLRAVVAASGEFGPVGDSGERVGGGYVAVSACAWTRGWQAGAAEG
jgi:hypothetical protein